MLQKWLLAVIFLAFCLSFQACCGGGGTSKPSSNATMGQELTDIQQAYDQKIITEEEYQKAKKTILKKYD